MKHGAEKAGLGAQGSDAQQTGFEMSYDGEALHADLARANLLRLRGEFGEAEQLCVKILENQPENAAAHTLLGDIAFTQDRADQAAEHYEIAQSLDPLSPDISRKLANARALQLNRETATTAEQLGLTRANATPWLNIALFTFLAVLVVVALVLVMQTPQGPVALNKVAAPPIVATSDTIANPVKPKSKPADGQATGANTEVATVGGDATPAPTANPPALDQPPTSTVAQGASQEDRTIFQTIQGQSTLGSRLQSVVQDPRTKNVTLTYNVAAGDDARRIGAELGKTTLDKVGDAQAITLRAVRDDKLIYMADMLRTRYADTLPDEWRQSNPGEDAWIAYSITNEWPYRSTDSPENRGTGTAGTSNSKGQ
jgi:hypothetical protein